MHLTAALLHERCTMMRRVPFAFDACRCLTTPATCVAVRSFVQGAPPVSKDAEEKRRQHFQRAQHADGVEDKYKRRQRELHEFFSTHEPNCPEPLEENAFVKGKFGMRRRYLVDHRGKIDAGELNDALDSSTNAMRK